MNDSVTFTAALIIRLIVYYFNHQFTVKSLLQVIYHIIEYLVVLDGQNQKGSTLVVFQNQPIKSIHFVTVRKVKRTVKSIFCDV